MGFVISGWDLSNMGPIQCGTVDTFGFCQIWVEVCQIWVGTQGSICYYYPDPSVPCSGVCHLKWDLSYMGGFVTGFVNSLGFITGLGVCHLWVGFVTYGVREDTFGFCQIWVGVCQIWVGTQGSICYYYPDPSVPCSRVCHLKWDLSYMGSIPDLTNPKPIFDKPLYS